MSLSGVTQFLAALSAATCGLICYGGWRRRTLSLARGAPGGPRDLDRSDLEPGRAPCRSQAMDVVAEVRMVLGSAVSLAARKRVRLEFAVPPGLEVHTDPRLFRSMLRDLLKQALDQATDGSVLIGARRQDSQVIITVCDDGTGQDQADQEAARRRTGELLLRQGATMRIDVRPGQGTTVIVCLPDSVSATSASPGGSPDQGGAATHSRTPDGMAERGPNHD